MSAPETGRRSREEKTHVVTIDGELVGGWKRASSARRAVVELSLGARLTSAETKAVAAAAARYGRFLGAPVELR